MFYIDIPSSSDLNSLASTRADICVSIYLPTTPATRESAGDRIALKSLARDAIKRLNDDGAAKHQAAELAELLDDLIDDDEFWRFQARSLAIFATPDRIRTFRVVNSLEPLVLVSDRFHLKPLLRAVTFPNVAYVLALAEGSVRLVEVLADLPAEVIKVDGMPRNAANAVGRSSVNDRSPSGRLQGSEGQKILLRQFARKVDKALRGLLSGNDIPLVLAATEPLASIFRSVNSYPHLATTTIGGSPRTLADGELAERARIVLDELYRDNLTTLRQLYETRENQGRATTDVAQTARAATFGAVDTLLVDIDAVALGTIDDDSGAVTFADGTNPSGYDLADEIASRVIRFGGRVLGVRKNEVPGGKSLAAILRYSV